MIKRAVFSKMNFVIAMKLLNFSNFPLGIEIFSVDVHKMFWV